MVDPEFGRWKRRSRKESVKDFGGDGRDQARRICLMWCGRLALGEVRAARLAQVYLEGVARFRFEDVVNQVRRKGDQVGEQKARRQTARSGDSPRGIKPFHLLAHDEAILADFSRPTRPSIASLDKLPATPLCLHHHKGVQVEKAYPVP